MLRVANMRRTLQGHAIHARLYRGYTMRLLAIPPTLFVWHTFGGLANLYFSRYNKRILLLELKVGKKPGNSVK
jgi:hypothetical protein